MGRPIEAPTIPSQATIPNQAQLPDPMPLPDPNVSALFPELTPPADEADMGVDTSGVDLTELVPDFFGF